MVLQLTVIQLAGILIVAILAGLFGSLVGLGGGLILTPILTVGFGIDIKMAIAASIIAVIATSCAGASVYVERRQVNIRLGMVLETTTTIGAVIGAMLTAVLLDQNIVTAIFVGILVYAAFYMLFRPETVQQTDGKKGALSGSYYDEKAGKNVEYDVKHVERGLAASFFAGNMSGILGVGGGLIKVPAMNVWMKVPIKAAVATSNFMIGVTAVASAYIYYTHGFMSTVLTGVVAVGVFLGARTGSGLSNKIDAGKLRAVFIAVMIIMALLLVARIFGYGVPVR